ncbi:EAL domain-containing protein [Hyphomicrobium sp.]|uniref:putative bifunctional diguanylate cyclase/phosphodiesterase n=2 Tax=Hyphomicrobium sp. TaxID=82 RepID=UPI0025B8BF9C|nr:EAL domain-containing protein [Hyphomicrobium sp.]
MALSNMGRGLSMFNADQRLVMCNRLYREIYQLPARLTRPGTSLASIVRYHVRRETGRDDAGERAKQRAWIKGHVAQLARGKTFVHVQRLKSGRIVQVTNQPLAAGGWIDIQEDITERRRAEERIDWLAHHDPLTETANRTQFGNELEHALLQLKHGSSFALHWIDLDRFKAVNDTLGHPAGDALLKSVAKRLLKAVRKPDLVARLGGDEFAVIQVGATRAEAEVLGKRLVKALREPHLALGHRLETSASIGIALAPEHGTNADELMHNADLALYRAKAAGRAASVVYEPARDTHGCARGVLEADLKRALAEEQLELHYQPIIDSRTSAVNSFEALMRWRHPERGLLAPGEFIGLAESTGLIIEIGAWAIRRACTDAATWPAPIKVTVNLSPVQFESGDLYETIVGAIASSGIDPQRIEVEITESVLLRDDPKTHALLHKLRDLGLRIALDDFGTAYASLSYLRSFPFDKIKIDRSFVRDLNSVRREDSIAIIRAVASLAKQLQMTSVAEGVETAEQIESVLVAGCDELQGFYFSTPVPAGDVPGLLSRGAPTRPRQRSVAIDGVDLMGATARRA